MHELRSTHSVAMLSVSPFFFGSTRAHGQLARRQANVEAVALWISARLDHWIPTHLSVFTVLGTRRFPPPCPDAVATRAGRRGSGRGVGKAPTHGTIIYSVLYNYLNVTTYTSPGNSVRVYEKKENHIEEKRRKKNLQPKAEVLFFLLFDRCFGEGRRF